MENEKKIKEIVAKIYDLTEELWASYEDSDDLDYEVHQIQHACSQIEDIAESDPAAQEAEREEFRAWVENQCLARSERRGA